MLNKEAVAEFEPYDGPGAEGCFTDFLGGKTSVAYLPEPYRKFSGKVLAAPTPDGEFLHDHAEWLATLTSVLEAGGRMVACELGAGWGPWIVVAGLAAKKRGIADVKLIAVEPSGRHFGFLNDHLRDNGFDPERHHLFKGAVGNHDGKAYFPKPRMESGGDWDASASYSAAPQFDEVPCTTLATMLRAVQTVDILHCDIQGAEADVLIPSLQVLREKVRRVVIGTHSRTIEDRLIQAFASGKWELEAEGPCRYSQDNPLQLARDGYQVWRNSVAKPF